MKGEELTINARKEPPTTFYCIITLIFEPIFQLDFLLAE